MTARRPRGKRSWVVPALLLAGFVVAVTLIVSGRAKGGSAGTASDSAVASSTTATAGKQLRWLGSFTSDDQVRLAVNQLNVRTLTPSPTGSDVAPTSSLPVGTQPVTDADATRCDRGITKISTDPLGSRLAAVGGSLKSSPVLIATYEVPVANDHPKGVRLFIVDVASCRVIAAVDYPNR